MVLPEKIDTPLTLDVLQAEEMTRRRVLTCLASGALTAVTYNLPWLVKEAGEICDNVISPESIIGDPVIALEPREYDTPLVYPCALGRPVKIDVVYEDSKTSTSLSLDPKNTLSAECTNTPVEAGKFIAVGTAVITTAEGIEHGKQEYCALYRSFTNNGEQLIAVGYEGGMYTYQRALASEKTGSSGEWVRIVQRGTDVGLPSPVTTDWKDPVTPHGMLIENVIQGNETLNKIGYRPWAAVLPNTKMPSMVEKQITTEECASSVRQVTNGDYKLFVTKRGDIIDIPHLFAKAGETFDLFLQLCYARVSGEENPVVGVRYSRGSDAVFEFVIHPDSLSDDNIFDAAFAVMTTESMLMEGVSQRYAAEKVPLLDKLHATEGLSSEDPFTNSVGIVGMIDLIRKHNLTQLLESSLKMIYQRHKGATTAEMRETLEEELADLRDGFAKHILDNAARNFGVRDQKPGIYTLPRGLSPLVPTKVSSADAATPTHINLADAGIKAGNPCVRFTPVAIPAMEPTFEKILRMARDKIGL